MAQWSRRCSRRRAEDHPDDDVPAGARLARWSTNADDVVLTIAPSCAASYARRTATPSGATGAAAPPAWPLSSLGWAIGYNAVALPIAAGVFSPSIDFVLRPEIAALTMPGSSLLVATHALLLKRLRLPAVPDD